MDILTDIDALVLGANLAFIRGERDTQRRRARLFVGPMGPTARHRNLQDLCDAVAEQLLAILRSTDDWQRLQARHQRVAMRTLELGVERVARHGIGLYEEEIDALETTARQQLVEALGFDGLLAADQWGVRHTRLLVPVTDRGGRLQLWPAAIPRPLIAEAIGRTLDAAPARQEA